MKSWLLLLVALCCAAAVAARTETPSIEEAVEYYRKLFLIDPLDKFIISVSYTTLEAQKPSHNDIELSHDETWGSWCLDVTLRVDIPKRFETILPDTLWNFKVFYNRVVVPANSTDDETLICSMMVFECPDGSEATRTKDCQFICGAAPIGGLSYEQVNTVKSEFKAAYGHAVSVSIDTLYGKEVKLTSAEKMSDYCLDVTFSSPASSSNYPAVFNGVRIFYHTYSCSPKRCSDGSMVGCNSECPAHATSKKSVVFMPLVSVLFVVILSACCCCLRRRRRGINRCREGMYPSQHYELLKQNEQETAAPQSAVPMMTPPTMPAHHPMMPMMMPTMAPHLVQPMGMPPMPPMMMMPNGAYPVMMQAPNGMWFSVPPHPEDV